MTSLNASVNSLDPAPFGALLHSDSTTQPLQRHPQPTVSILSHHTPSPQQQVLTFTHPVVTEWSKAYDMVVKFRDNLVDLLSDNCHLAELAEELRSVDVHTLDKSQEVQGQITQMRWVWPTV